MIGILTFHRAVNYGAVLQSYALQRTLTELGIENEIIDYRTKVIEGLYSPWSLHDIKTLQFFQQLNKNMRFTRFVNRWIHLSSPCRSVDEIANMESDYHTLITGSDQVWCKKCAVNEPAYFLNFVKDSEKKKSYAASIGNAYMDSEIADIYKKYLGDFSEISVRELSAKGLLEHGIYSQNIDVHIDPTLLLDSDKWDVVRKKNLEKKPYILVYTVLGQYRLLEEAKKLAKETGYKVIYLNDDVLNRESGIYYRGAVSPEEFIGYFAEAEYVLTNSFHGTAFSIIYNKYFKVEIEAVGRKNIRSEELLHKLGIEDRALNADGIASMDAPIDWGQVNRKLLSERAKSADYLKSICE